MPDTTLVKPVKQEPELDQKLYVTREKSYSIFQIRTTKKSDNAVAEFNFDGQLEPNLTVSKMPNVEFYKFSNTKTKSPQATYCAVRIFQQHEMTGKFGDQVAEMIATQAVPAVMKTIQETSYKGEPKDIRFYLHKKCAHHFDFLNNALQMTGYPLEEIKVDFKQAPSVRGIALALEKN